MFSIDLDDPDVIDIQKHVKFEKYKKGDIILRPHDKTRYLHTVVSGLVKAYTVNRRGDATIILIYGPDELFPLNWIINQRPHNVYFEALTDCKIALLPQDVFLDFMQTKPAITLGVLHTLLELTSVYSTRVTNLELKYARERLAYHLLLLVARFGEKHNGSLSIPHISQQDLASMINVSREGVSREMNRFERLGLINYSSVKIVIKDPQKLRKEVGEEVSILYFDKA